MATAANNPVAVIRQNLTAMAPEFRAALPSHVPVEKFTRVAMTAIQNNPELQNADRRSLFGAIVRLAQDGLLPDGREAAIVIFNTKNRTGGWEQKAQAMPMIAGILKKIRQSGEVARVSAHVVYEHDDFVWKLGFDETVEHSPPPLDQPRGKPIGAYATAVLKDGSQLCEVMSLEEIEKVRAVSRSKDKGPWVQWWGEMARKTVMRRLSKRLPMSTDIDDQFERDATMARSDEPEPAVVDVQAEEPVSRLDALEHHIGEDDADSDTGEIETVEAEPVEEADDEAGMHAGEDEPDQAEEEQADDMTLSPAEQFLAGLRHDIEAAPTVAELKKVGQRWDNNRVAYDGDEAVLDEIDGLIAARRRALSGGESAK